MPTVGDEPIHELVLRTNAFGQQIRNVFYYRQITGSLSELSGDALTAAFISDVVSEIRALLPTEVNFAACSYRRVNSVIDFGSQSIGYSGTGAGNAELVYLAALFRFARLTKETGNGSKRLGPVASGSYSDNVFGGTFLTGAATVAAAMAATLNGVGVGNFAPVICGHKRTKAGVAIPEEDWIWTFVTGVTVSNYVTTQNSRKVGRGI